MKTLKVYKASEARVHYFRGDEYTWEESDEDCKHFNAKVEMSCTVGHAHCPDCNTDPHLAEVFNNWMERFRSIYANII